MFSRLFFKMSFPFVINRQRRRIKEMGKHLNAYSHMYNMLYNPIFKDFDYLKPNSPLNIKITELLPKLHQQIFSWAFESDWKILRDKSKGKGIVFTAGLFILI